MIMRGQTPRSLSWLGVFTILMLGLLLLPWLPSWGQATTPEKRGFHPGSVRDLTEEIERLTDQVDLKKALLRKAEAGRTLAQSVFDAKKKHFDQGAVGAETLARTRGELEIAAADVDVARAELREAELKLTQVRRQLAELTAAEAPRSEVADEGPGSSPATIEGTDAHQRAVTKPRQETDAGEEPSRERTPRDRPPDQGPPASAFRPLGMPRMMGGMPGMGGMMVPGMMRNRHQERKGEEVKRAPFPMPGMEGMMPGFPGMPGMMPGFPGMPGKTDHLDPDQIKEWNERFKRFREEMSRAMPGMMPGYPAMPGFPGMPGKIDPLDLDQVKEWNERFKRFHEEIQRLRHPIRREEPETQSPPTSSEDAPPAVESDAPGDGAPVPRPEASGEPSSESSPSDSVQDGIPTSEPEAPGS